MTTEPQGRIPLYVLAGGQSRRFGSDKARALVNGQPLILHIAGSLAPVSASVCVVAARPGLYGDLGLRTIGDEHPGLGPVAGLEAALSDAGGAGWILLTSCDLVSPKTSWVQILLAAAANGPQAVVFRGEHVEGLFGAYHTSALEPVRGFLAGGGRAVHHLLDQLKTTYLPLPQDWPALPHINTLAELERALKRSIPPW